MSKTTMKKLWVTCGVLIILGGGTAGYWRYFRGGNEEVKFRAEPVTRGEITSIVNSSGTVNPLMRVDLGSQVSGIVQKLHFDFNDSIKANDLVAEIDPSTYEARVTESEASLARTSADTAFAKVGLDRARSLVENKVGTQSELDAAKAKYDMAVAAEKQARASLEQAQTNLRNTKIYSPIDGIVIDRKVEVGQTVAAGLNVAVLFVIANDLTKMQVNTLVDESDIGRVQEGQDAEFSVDAFPRDVFRGKVHQVRNAAIVKQDVVNYDVIVRVENPDKKLKPGMTANVSIIVNHREDVLRVPNAALRFKPPMKESDATPMAAPSGQGNGGRSGGGKRRTKAESHVYVLRDGKPEKIKIEIGTQDDSHAEVLSGLQENQEVLIGMTYPKGATATGGQQPTSPWSMRRF